MSRPNDRFSWPFALPVCGDLHRMTEMKEQCSNQGCRYTSNVCASGSGSRISNYIRAWIQIHGLIYKGFYITEKMIFDLLSLIRIRIHCLKTCGSYANPDPTWRVISDPDPASGYFWIPILVCEMFVKFSHIKTSVFRIRN